MDIVVTYAIRLWIGAIVLVMLPWLLLWPLRGCVRILRWLPSLNTRLTPTSARLAQWNDRLLPVSLGVFYLAILWPILAVALPVAGITWLLLHWLLPDRPPQPEAEAEHHTPLSAMEWPLRLVTITAIAQLLTTAALIWLLKVPASPIVIGTLDGTPVQIDRLVVITVSAFLPVGFGLLLSGAWVHTISRVLVLAVLAISSRPAVWHGSPLVAWLAFLIALAACAVEPAWRRHGQGSTALDFVRRAGVISLGFAAYLGISAWGLTSSGLSYVAWLDRLVSEQVFMVAPVLFLAGVDFVGLGSALGRRMTRWTLGVPSGRAAAAIALLAAVAGAGVAWWTGSIDASGLTSLLVLVAVATVLFVIIALVSSGFSLLGRFDLYVSVLMVIAAVGGLLALFIYTEWRLLVTGIAVAALGATIALLRSREGTWSNAGLTMAAVVTIAVVLAGSREVVILVQSQYEIPPDARTTSFRVERIDTLAGPVSAGVPTYWVSSPRPDHLYYSDGQDPYATGAFLIGVYDPATLGGTGLSALASGVAALLPDFPIVGLSFDNDYDTRSARWRHSNTTVIRDGRRYLIDVFDHRERGVVWVLLFITGERYERYFAPAILGVVGSWRFDLSATPPNAVKAPDLRRRVASLGGFGFMPILFAPVGCWMLYRKRNSPSIGTIRDHGALLAVVVAATAVLFLPDTALVEFWRESQAAANPLATLQLILAGATALLVALFAFTGPLNRAIPLLREAASTNIALLTMAIVYAIYGAAIPLGNRRVEIEVAIFVIALVWDLSTSGREITGTDGPTFPRPARVLSYLGYLVVVSTITLFISTQTLGTGGESVPKLVESEEVVRQGLVWLGAPVLLLRAALRWMDALRHGHLED